VATWPRCHLEHYYPPSNRGVGVFLGNFLIATGQRRTDTFLLGRYPAKTSEGKRHLT